MKPGGVSFFLSYHPEFAENFKQGFGEQMMATEEVVLTPLSVSASAEFAQKLLGAQADEGLKQFLYERSLGNPTVIEQWTGYLIDKKLIAREDEVWKLQKEVDQAEIPDDLYSLVFSRLDRLSQETRHALKLGAVYGTMHFPSSILTNILGKKEVDSLMAPAVDAGLV